jgi:hypothetical protein
MLSSFGMGVLVVYFVTRARARRVELQTEMQGKLIDRFGSAPEMVAFLQSPAGKEFVAGVQSNPSILTRERVLGSLTRAIVLTALGVAFLFLTFWEDNDFIVPAAIVLSIGIGYLIATLVSWRLSASLTARPDDISRA